MGAFNSLKNMKSLLQTKIDGFNNQKYFQNLITLM